MCEWDYFRHSAIWYGNDSAWEKDQAFKNYDFVLPIYRPQNIYANIFSLKEEKNEGNVHLKTKICMKQRVIYVTLFS